MGAVEKSLGKGKRHVGDPLMNLCSAGWAVVRHLGVRRGFGFDGWACVDCGSKEYMIDGGGIGGVPAAPQLTDIRDRLVGISLDAFGRSVFVGARVVLLCRRCRVVGVVALIALQRASEASVDRWWDCGGRLSLRRWGDRAARRRETLGRSSARGTEL